MDFMVMRLSLRETWRLQRLSARLDTNCGRVLSLAFSLLKVIMREKRSGNRICVLDKDGNIIREIVI